MSKLLENVIKNRSRQLLREGDMLNLGNAMMRHLGSSFPYDSEDNLPIEPEGSRWVQLQISDKICIQRTY